MSQSFLRVDLKCRQSNRSLVYRTVTVSVHVRPQHDVWHVLYRDCVEYRNVSVKGANDDEDIL